MGVNNLFTVLPDVTIDEAMAFEVMTAGQSIAIDASNWLHEYGDNTDLKRAWESRINQMIKHSITPIFCFDGLRNPGKATTDGDRDQARQEGKKKAMELFSTKESGADLLAAARQAFTITQELVHDVIDNVLRYNTILCS